MLKVGTARAAQPDGRATFWWRVCTTLILALLAAPASAQKKHAFVVGIDNYDNLAIDRQLQKAVGDATAISDTLSGMGFTVVTVPNVTRPVFNERWQSFLDVIKPGDTTAFVFSGHGVEINGANYLLPRDVPRLRLGRDEQLKRESLALVEILTDLRERRPGFSLIVLDACRDNPFAEGGKAIGGTKGLARIDPPEGTFIMYSAGAHQTALDRLAETDRATTSIYTRTLLPLLKTPGLSLLDMADRLGEQVRDLAATISHRQTPAFYSGVIGGRRVCLAGCEVALTIQPPPQPSFGATAEAVRICREVEGLSSLSMLAVLERQHKGTPAADCVAARIDEIKRTQAAAQVDTDRQRLALVQQQETERLARDAAAAKAAQDAAEAQRMAEEAAKVKAEMERQRLVMLRQEEGRKAAEAEAVAKRKTIDDAAAKAVMDAKVKSEADIAAGKAATEAARTALIQKLQTELKRVSCYSGAVDGLWGANARNALAQFSKLTKIALANEQPTEIALKALVDRKALVCHVTCDSGEQAINGKCVERATAPPQRPVERATTPAKSSSQSPPGEGGDCLKVMGGGHSCVDAGGRKCTGVGGMRICN